MKTEQPIKKIVYREGELEKMLTVRNKFVDLIDQYSSQANVLSRSKLLGSIFDTVFYIGICNLRKHMPSVKEVYLNVGDSRNKSLRNLELLEEMAIVFRDSDKNDSRVKRVQLTEKFRHDFEIFVEQWLDSREAVTESA